MTVSYKKLGAGSQAGNYYLAASNLDDYYSNDGAKEPSGIWFDKGSTLPGIAHCAKTDPKAFRALMGGYSPHTGEALCQGAGETHVAGYDFTFSAPKAVSSIWAVADPEIRSRIEEINIEATQTALSFLSRHAGVTRRGKGGQIKEQIELVAGVFPHGSSRENDPQLHVHSVILNLCRRKDGTYGTIDINQALKYQGAVAGVYHTALAAGLTRELGIECSVAEDKFIFSLPRVPKRVLDHWSKRRRQIKAKIGGASYIDRAVVQRAVLETRDAKDSLTHDELVARWADEGLQIGFTRKDVDKLLNRKKYTPITKAQREEVALKVPPFLTELRSVFTKPQLLSALGVKLQGMGDSCDIEAAAKLLLDNKHILVLAHGDDGQEILSTTEMIELERHMIELAKLETRAHIQPRDVVTHILDRHKELSDEQIQAVKWACTKGMVVSVIEGIAGSGKSKTLEAVREIYESTGYTVHGIALPWKAAEALTESAKLKYARAIEGFLRDIEARHLLLDTKSVVLVDECGPVGSRHMERILAAASEAGAKVILTGDTKQLLPVAAGGAVEAIVEEIGSRRIDIVRRQSTVWQREAVTEFADGKGLQALERYRSHGAIRFCVGEDETLDAMVDEWARFCSEHRGSSALLLGHDNASVRKLNQLARNRLINGRFLSGEDVTIRTSDLRNSYDDQFCVGDKIMFRKNDKNLGIAGDPTKKQEGSGVYNRSLGVIERIRIGKDGVAELTVRLNRGSVATIKAGPGGYWDPTKKGVPIQHAYATTIYSSKGLTVDQVFLKDAALMDRRLAYVGMSRHRHGCSVFIDREAVNERMCARLGPDKWMPLHRMSNDAAFEFVARAWSRPTEKRTTMHYLRPCDHNVGTEDKVDSIAKTDQVCKEVETARVEAIHTLEENSTRTNLKEIFAKLMAAVKRFRAKNGLTSPLVDVSKFLAHTSAGKSETRFRR